MKFLRRLSIRLSNFVTRRSADQRLREQIAARLAFRTEEGLRTGMPATEARQQATSERSSYLFTPRLSRRRSRSRNVPPSVQSPGAYIACLA